MKNRRDPIDTGGRRSRLNRYILILVLLWIAATVALLVEVHPSHAHANGMENNSVYHLASVMPPNC